ncbi:MAG: 3-hydroxyacyl-ACP dehydratase [Bacteroidota bacterium]|nr:3-hydroxyacyl-ACP dehydratase [Bacteroidota bacterium]
MLLKDFYKIIRIEHNSGQISNAEVVIELNAKHEVFKGHFPDNPVTPGVCMMQIIKELSEKILGERLFLTSASNVKFMAIINPNINPILRLELAITQSEGVVKVKNTTWMEDVMALKLSNVYKIV